MANALMLGHGGWDLPALPVGHRGPPWPPQLWTLGPVGQGEAECGPRTWGKLAQDSHCPPASQCGPVGLQGARPPGACLVVRTHRDARQGPAAWLAGAWRSMEGSGHGWEDRALVDIQQKAPAPQGAPNNQAAQ